jgi:hypothetical protein
MESASNCLPRWMANDSYFSGRGLSLLLCPLGIEHCAVRGVAFRVPSRRTKMIRRVGCDQKQFLRQMMSSEDASHYVLFMQEPYAQSILAMNH